MKCNLKLIYVYSKQDNLLFFFCEYGCAYQRFAIKTRTCCNFTRQKHHKHNNLADKAIYKHIHCSQNQQWRALSQEQRGITLQHAAKRKDSPEKCDSVEYEKHK